NPVAVPVHALADQALDVVRELFIEFHRVPPAGLRSRPAPLRTSDTHVFRPSTGPSWFLIFPSGFAFSIALARS
ncbi:TPA: hypothetical protein U2L48_000949, partial [Burkholderia cepacia]|nr:hypothetical protein [Burkholderia cepacia]